MSAASAACHRAHREGLEEANQLRAQLNTGEGRVVDDDRVPVAILWSVRWEARKAEDAGGRPAHYYVHSRGDVLREALLQRVFNLVLVAILVPEVRLAHAPAGGR